MQMNNNCKSLRKNYCKLCRKDTAGLLAMLLPVETWLLNSSLHGHKTPPKWYKCLTGPQLFWNNAVYVKPLLSPSGSLEFQYMPGKGGLGDQPPTKALGAESLMSFPGRWHFTFVIPIRCWKNGAHPVWLWRGEHGEAWLVPLVSSWPHRAWQHHVTHTEEEGLRKFIYANRGSTNNVSSGERVSS